MNRKRKTLEKLAKDVGVATAKSYFEMFYDEKNRGEYFRWEYLPNLAYRMAIAQMGTSCSEREYERLGKHLVIIAGDSAFEEAKGLIEQKFPGTIIVEKEENYEEKY